MSLRATPKLRSLKPYRVPRHQAPIDLRLDGNEGPEPAGLCREVAQLFNDEALRRYPKVEGLQEQLANRHGLELNQVLVCSGADDALDRACRALLCSGREMILPSPTFEMLPRYAHLAGATITTLPWRSGPYPTQEVLAKVSEKTAAIAIVSPNNPTGAVASAADLQQLAKAAPNVALFVDLAYAEFADEDLTEAALELPNAIVFRTLSKAYGLAGARVGYALANPQVLTWLRAVGNPYAVSSPSIALASERLRTANIEPYLGRIRAERIDLQKQLVELGLRAPRSQANFVFAEGSRALWLRDGLASLGIGIRAWPGHEQLGQAVRLTCPGNKDDFDRLQLAIASTLDPQAILFDMDGVLANVEESYRKAIVLTVGSYGIVIDQQRVSAEKAKGNANNDWILCQRILQSEGVEAPFSAIKDRFEEFYQGGLWQKETLRCKVDWLKKMAARLPLGIVTGRPRHDAERFLETFQIRDVFASVVCLEDAASKPDPAPVQLALEQLAVERAWLLGDTPDDVVAARKAGVVAIGVGQAALESVGAARTVNDLTQIEEWIR